MDQSSSPGQNIFRILWNLNYIILYPLIISPTCAMSPSFNHLNYIVAEYTFMELLLMQLKFSICGLLQYCGLNGVSLTGFENCDWKYLRGFP